MEITKLAQAIDQAVLDAKPIQQLSAQTEFDLDTSYAIQAASLQLRYDRGEKLIGLKMGFTSEAKMKQMGVHDLIWGRLTDAMLIEQGGELPLSKFIHPRAEPEICFRVSKAIEGELTAEECRNYVDGVAAAIEVIDSRYEQFKFSLEDVIADNCSSAALVIGDWQDPTQPLADLSISLEVNGEAVQTGSSDAILGDPWKSMAAATRLAVKYGEHIKAGDVIMAGAATSAIFLEAGQSVAAQVQNLGAAGFNVS